jgi:hypothetical protein
MVSYQQVMEDNDKLRQSETILQEVYKTIDRQVLSLASLVAFYNFHQLIAKPKKKEKEKKKVFNGYCGWSKIH